MKTILFAIAAVVASVGAHAEYLYWQVQSSDLPDFASDATGARVFVSNDNGVSDRHYLNIGYADYDTGFGNIGYAVQVPVNDTSLVAEFDSSTYGSGNYAFFIELINYAETYRTSDAATPAYNATGTPFKGQTAEGQSYAQLAEHGYVGTDLSPINMSVWHGGAYSPVPEPTSAMLVLFGLAGLALRRRAV